MEWGICQMLIIKNSEATQAAPNPKVIAWVFTYVFQVVAKAENKIARSARIARMGS